MPSEYGKAIFLRAKHEILEELHAKYGVPKISVSALQPYSTDVIGRGNFAEVFKVMVVDSMNNDHTTTTRLNVGVVAAKILKEDGIDSKLVSLPRPTQGKKVNEVPKEVEKLLAYYKRECVVWKRCSEDNRLARENNIVELFGLVDSYNDSHMPVFISRYIPEGSVESYLKNKSKPALSTRDRILIMSDVAKALDFLHTLKIVHRDIKARNVLLEQTGERFVGLLADFGSSKVLQEDLLRNTSTTRSDRRWEPPEYIKEHGAFHNEDGPGDIWALGCTFLEILQEQAPWQPLNEVEYKLRLCHCECPIRGETENMTHSKRKMTFRHVEDICYEFMKKFWGAEKNNRISPAEAHIQLLELARVCTP